MMATVPAIKDDPTLYIIVVLGLITSGDAALVTLAYVGILKRALARDHDGSLRNFSEVIHPCSVHRPALIHQKFHIATNSTCNLRSTRT